MQGFWGTIKPLNHTDGRLHWGLGSGWWRNRWVYKKKYDMNNGIESILSLKSILAHIAQMKLLAGWNKSH